MFAPETEVRFLANVEYDVNFSNVRHFSSRDRETDYFINKTKFYFPTCAVQDVYGYSGFIIAPINAGMSIDSYYDCNYLMYKNTQISNKWFYATLGTPQPLSKRACRIPYKVDLWRTWFMDCTIGQCYVEREHVNNDTVGKWLKPENVDTGEFIAVPPTGSSLGYDLTDELDNRNCIVVVNSFAPATNDGYEINYTSGELSGTYQLPGMNPEFVGGFLCGGIYQGAMFVAFPYDVNTFNTVVASVNQYIKSIVTNGQGDRIQGIFMCPYWICRQVANKTSITQIANNMRPIVEPVHAYGSPASFDGYVPRNNKLFTGQFNYFIIDNGAGVQEEYQYEYFYKKRAGAKSIPFDIYGQLSIAPSMRLVPDNYKCLLSDSGRNNELYAMELSGFPSGSYSYSEVANAWNQRELQRRVSYESDQWTMKKTQRNRAVSGISSLVNTIGGIVDTGEAIGAGDMSKTISGVRGTLNSRAGVINSQFPVRDEFLRVAQNEAAYADSRRIPNIIRGNANGSIAFPLGRLTFTQYQMQIKESYAKRIDKYFDAFGYTIDEIKAPNLTGRRCWNYVKTANAVVNGNIPEEARAFIADVLNSGVRLWHDGAAWLDYSQSNSII